jgi:transcriptional regulator with XRE-family HTH domain
MINIFEYLSLSMISYMDLLRQLEQRRIELGMPRKALSRRTGVSLPTVNRILSGKDQNPQLRNLEAIARALAVAIRLGATVGVDPVEDAFEIRKKQATEKAQKIVRMVQGTMGLEAQGVGVAAQHQMIEQTVCELLAGSSRRLWSE